MYRLILIFAFAALMGCEKDTTPTPLPAEIGKEDIARIYDVPEKTVLKDSEICFDVDTLVALLEERLSCAQDQAVIDELLSELNGINQDHPGSILRVFKVMNLWGDLMGHQGQAFALNQLLNNNLALFNCQ